MIGTLSILTLAITQTGLLQTVLNKYHIVLVDKQIFTITISTAIGSVGVLLIGIPSVVIPSCKACSSRGNADNTNTTSNQSPDTPISTQRSQTQRFNLNPAKKVAHKRPLKTLSATEYTPKKFQQLLRAGSAFPTGPIVVTGNLDLSDTYDFDLSITSNIDLGSWTNRINSLLPLPQVLHVRGSLNLSDCCLISLPQFLHVGCDLSLSRSTNLTSLPEGLHVGRDLDLNDCTNLTTLPEGLHVGGNLRLIRGTGLTSLPEGLHVGGHLDLYGCTNLMALPPGLRIGCNLVLSRCTSVTTLPERLQIAGKLNLDGCTRLTSLPSWITALGPRPGGRTRTINLENTGLSENILTRLREVNAPGMRFIFSHAASKPLQSFKTLDGAFKFWEIVPQPVIDLEDQALECVLAFLGRLTTTPEYQNLQARPGLKQRLIEAFNLMVSDEETKDLAVTIISHGLTSCDDRIISALDEIELVVRIQQVGDSENELRKLGRSMLLLEMVDKEAQKHAKTLTWVDEIEISLAFRIGLTQKLGLPLSTQNMRFRNCAQITDEQILATGDVILRKCSDECVDAYLKTWGPWMKYQRSLCVTLYDHLPMAQVKGKENEVCSIFGHIPTQSVLYNEQVYDYETFRKIFIDTGINPFTRTQITWSELKRI